jgi:cyanophycinase
MSDEPTRFLIGGGWQPEHRDEVYGPFLAAAGSHPTIGCVVLDEGDGAEQFERWAAALRATSACTPVPVLVPLGGVLDLGALAGVDGVLVGGGLTPGYAAAISPVAIGLRSVLRERGIPYAGFSAGASIAARRALVGGWLDRGVPICSEDAGEDLAELTVTEGLALLPVTVDVHAAQWGTLARLIAAVAAGLVDSGVAIDEDTLLAEGNGAATVCGAGQVHWVRRGETAVLVTGFRAGALPDGVLTG